MKRMLQLIEKFFRHLGDLHYYKGVEKLSWSEWVWKRRIGFRTAWKLAKIIVGPVEHKVIITITSTEDGEKYKTS